MSKKSNAINQALKNEPDENQLYEKMVNEMDPEAPADVTPVQQETKSNSGSLPEQPAQMPASPYTAPKVEYAGPDKTESPKSPYSELANLVNKEAKAPATSPTLGGDVRPAQGREALDAALQSASDRLSAPVQSAVDQAAGAARVGSAVSSVTDAAKAGAQQANSPTTTAATPPGFDQTKWNDPNHNTPKYVGGRILANGGSTQDVVNALGAGWSVIDGQRIRDPQGRTIDVMFGYQQGLRQPQWNVEGGGDGENDAPITNASSGTAGAAGVAGLNTQANSQQVSSTDALIRALLESVSPGAGQGAATGQGGGFNDQIRQSILNRLASVQGGVSINDPAIRQRLNAYTAASQASLRRGQSQFAERAYAEGLPAGAQDANLQGAIQNSAASEGQYAADITGEQIKANRDELEQLLQLGAGILTADEDRRIRAEIAALDAQLQQSSLGQQNTQFYDNLGANIGQNEALLNQRISEWLGQ